MVTRGQEGLARVRPATREGHETRRTDKRCDYGGVGSLPQPYPISIGMAARDSDAYVATCDHSPPTGICALTVARRGSHHESQDTIRGVPHFSTQNTPTKTSSPRLPSRSDLHRVKNQRLHLDAAVHFLSRSIRTDSRGRAQFDKRSAARRRRITATDSGSANSCRSLRRKTKKDLSQSSYLFSRCGVLCCAQGREPRCSPR